MKINSDTLLNILLPKENNVLKEILQKTDTKMLANLGKNVSIEHILANFFEDVKTGSKSNETISNILKNANIFDELKNFSQDLKSLHKLISENPVLEKYKVKIETFMLDIAKINANNIKTQIENSGVFLESKIALSLDSELSKNQTNQIFLDNKIPNDMKATLLQLKQDILANPTLIQNSLQETLESSVDRLLTQIDYCQLLSLCSNSNYLYLPFLWDLLEEGDLSIAKGEEEKFYCQINLKLKERGEINLLVGLHKKDIEITMYIGQEKFKNHIQENLQKLKQGLNSAGLNLLSLKIFDLKEMQDLDKEEIFLQKNLIEPSFLFDVRV